MYCKLRHTGSLNLGGSNASADGKGPMNKNLKPYSHRWLVLYYVWIFIALGSYIEKHSYQTLWDRILVNKKA